MCIFGIGVGPVRSWVDGGFRLVFCAFRFSHGASSRCISGCLLSVGGRGDGGCGGIVCVELVCAAGW